MAFPKLLQKLFQNNGAGDKLNQDIIPDIPYSKVTDAPSVDSALSSTSENPVQNKVINSALDGKLSTSGGTMTGSLVMAHGSNSITGSASDYFVQINAAGNSGGGQLRLYGKDNTQHPGWIFLYVKNGNAPEKALILKGTGGLEWDGKPVLTGNSAGLTVVAESYSANSWYRKYSDGWIEQGGTFTATMNSHRGSKNVALPIAFSSACYSVAALHAEASDIGYTGDDASEKYTTTIRVSNVTNTNVVFTWSTDRGSSTDYARVTLAASLYLCGK